LGWSKRAGNLFGFLLNQKLVHFVVVIITFVVVFSNFTLDTKASATDKVRGTALSKLVKSDFSSVDDGGLIEESFSDDFPAGMTSQKYLEDETSVLRPQARVVFDSLEETREMEEIGSLTQGGSAIAKPEIASTKKTVQPRTGIIDYAVQSGDTISTIAAEFGISVNTVLWANNLSAHSLIRPGQNLLILPVSGVSHKVARGENLGAIAKKYNIEEEKIIAFNNISNVNQLKIGENLIIPGGSRVASAPVRTASYSGVSAITSIVKAPSTTAVSGNKMNWPTQGARITQYYSWRHQGLDIANKTGTPIYAADTGTIEFVGWNNGYGNNIIIDHGGGKKTRYAHLSKFYVKRGQTIDKGESIGEMGSTGWSTGPHLHFEVIISGTKYNPLNYIK
jgi:murein DD-endopeptidase MepM/ murein hydrolase activator NlpD